MTQVKKGGNPWCATCIEFMDKAVNELLELLLGGVLTGCKDLCENLPNKVEAVVCVFLCEIVGFEEFVNLVQDVDPNPIWLCEELDACATNDKAAAKITKVTLAPAQGPTGTNFTMTTDYTVTNEIGTGELGLIVWPPANEGFPMGGGWIIIDQQPGHYSTSVSFVAKPQQYDPWGPGLYNLTVTLCEGNCGSSHAHAFELSQYNTTLRITK